MSRLRQAYARRVLALGAAVSVVAVASVWTLKVVRSSRDHRVSVGGIAMDREGAATLPAGQVPEHAGGVVTLAFGGDVVFEGSGLSAIGTNPNGMFGRGALPMMSADISMVNLQSAVGSGGVPTSRQSAHLAPPSSFDALSSAGIDVVTMANSHVMDYGEQVFLQSLGLRDDAKVKVVGIGENSLDAYNPQIFEVRGTRVAVFGATNVFGSQAESRWIATEDQPGVASLKELDKFTYQIAAIRPQVETIVVYLNWGSVGQQCPSAEQQQIVARLNKAGVDVIVGSHSGQVSGAGWFEANGNANRTYVSYGLGNFAVPSRPGLSSQDGGVLFLQMVGRHTQNATWIPVQVNNGFPVVLTGPAADSAIEEWNARRSCSNLSPA